MEKAKSTPDAWDDDWVTKADSPTKAMDPLPSNKKLSKAERRARQAEFNRQLWEDAEAPKTSYFLNTRDDVPLKTEFKPAVKVLSRKPTPKAAGAIDPAGLQLLSLEDDEDDDEKDSTKTVMSLEERQKKAQLDREEKQKKYEEARQRLFGSGSTSESKHAGGGIAVSAQPNQVTRGQNKSKGGRDSRPSSSRDCKTRQIFDPDYSAKPDSTYVQRQDNQSKGGLWMPMEQQIIRNPRGPEKAGKAGFGFATRGEKV